MIDHSPIRSFAPAPSRWFCVAEEARRAGLACVACYLLLVVPLNYGLTSVTIAGAPLHYAVLAIGMICSLPTLPRASVLFVCPAILLTGALLRLLTSDVGFWAIRDASQVLDMQWLFVGWALVRERIGQTYWRHWPWYLLLACLYWNTYPLGRTLLHVGPRLGLHGNGLFGIYNSQWIAGLILLSMILFSHRIRGHWAVIIALLATCFVVQSMSRITLGGVVFGSCYLLLLGRIRLPHFLIGGLLMGTAIFIIQLLELEVQTRYGNFDLDLLLNAALSVIGEGDNQGATAGVDQRLQWWLLGIQDTLDEPLGLWWGRGYGVVLTDHAVAVGRATRELHNSWISSFCRLGLIGAIGLAVLYFGSIIRVLLRARGDLFHFTILFAMYVALVSFLQPGFENPQSSSIMWATFGILHALVSEATRPTTESSQDDSRSTPRFR